MDVGSIPNITGQCVGGRCERRDTRCLLLPMRQVIGESFLPVLIF
jgi:hypothetical protein